MGYWFTGPWGESFDDLIRTGQFSEENDENQPIFEAPNNQAYNDSFLTAESEKSTRPPLQKVIVFGLQGRTVEGFEEKDICLQSDNKQPDKEDLQLEIIWEDVDFNVKLYENKGFPMKSIELYFTS